MRHEYDDERYGPTLSILLFLLTRCPLHCLWLLQAMSTPIKQRCHDSHNPTEWHRTLLNDNVKVHTISPGFLATGLGGNTEASKAAGAGDPALAGGFVRDVVEGKRDADVGKVITRQGVQDW